MTESENDCVQIGIATLDIAALETKTAPVTAAKDAAIAERDRVDGLLSESNADGPRKKILVIERKLDDLRKKLDRPNQQYQEYLNALEIWEDRRLEIEGDSETPDSLRFFNQQLAGLASIPAQLDDAYSACVDVSVKIHEQLLGIADEYKKLYKPVQQFIERHALAEHFHLSFDVTIVESGFVAGLLEFINHSKKGSFSGTVEGKDAAQALPKQFDLNSREEVRRFVCKTIQCLRTDQQKTPPNNVPAQDQLLKGKKLDALLEFVFGLSYLLPSYALRWAGKDISELSPGERGTLLLVFYLLIDKSDIPLIIDQPEENLDNQTIFDVLVPSIKEAKCKRQIILVTHNPNLAVVCDADQVIHASLDKNNGNRVTYESGSIEHSFVNRKLVDILEGTWPAFDNRNRKYVRT